MHVLVKAFSGCRRLCRALRAALVVFVCKYLMAGINIGNNFGCDKGLYVACTDGGTISFGNNISLGRNVKIIAQGGSITIGDNSFIGDGAIITAKQSISIGAGALIAEYVVIRDQDHSLKTDPISQGGFITAPIVIEDNVWLAAKATVLKGVHIGEGAVIAAHALVNKNVETRCVVAGVPAVKIKARSLNLKNK